MNCWVLAVVASRIPCNLLSMKGVPNSAAPILFSRTPILGPASESEEPDASLHMTVPGYDTSKASCLTFAKPTAKQKRHPIRPRQKSSNPSSAPSKWLVYRAEPYECSQPVPALLVHLFSQGQRFWESGSIPEQPKLPKLNCRSA